MSLLADNAQLHLGCEWNLANSQPRFFGALIVLDIVYDTCEIREEDLSLSVVLSLFCSCP